MKLNDFVKNGRTLLGTKAFRIPDGEAPVRNHNELEQELKKRGLRPRLFGPFGDRNRVR